MTPTIRSPLVARLASSGNLATTSVLNIRLAAAAVGLFALALAGLLVAAPYSSAAKDARQTTRSKPTSHLDPSSHAAPTGRDYSGYAIATGPADQLTIKSTGPIGFSKSQSDTFYLYGGPGSVDGRFQTHLEDPGGLPDRQGWIGVDLTEGTPFWRASTTNAQDFTGTVPGNHAMISHDAIAVGGNFDGYGNSWNDWAVLTLSLADLGIDPADPSSVRWTCQYVHDIEPVWDFFHIDVHKGGGYINLLTVDGSSYVDTTGTYDSKDFDSDDHGGIEYEGGDYANGQTAIVLRYRVTSDGAWSDQDGLWPTHGRGAAGVDNVVVSVNGNIVSDADFEPLLPKLDNPPGDLSGVDNGAGNATLGWTPTTSTFCGDFSKVFGEFMDIDPCRDNRSPQFTFIDDGTPPNNGGGSTGGSISSTWNYGIPGGWVVNHSGGLTLGERPLDNHIWSPPIDWDLPGPADDVSNGGAVLGFTTWSHMPLANGIFRVWSIRSRQSGDLWSIWRDNNYVYYSDTPTYWNLTMDVSQHIIQDPDQVQISLGVIDLADAFDFNGDDATPAPCYDNVYLKKYVIGGPVVSTRTVDLASDGFPNDGTLTGSIRWDANLDNGPTAGAIVPGDSIAVDILPIIPGTELLDADTGGTLKVAHMLNPAYGDESGGTRQAGLAAVDNVTVAGTSSRGWKILTYEVDGVQVSVNGVPVDDRYSFDLPDGPPNVNAPHQSLEPGLVYPGDVIHYYIEAQDALSSAPGVAVHTTTLPEDLSGFLDFEPETGFDRIFTVRGLPGIDPATGEPPKVLFWNDFDHWWGEDEYVFAFGQIGYREGYNYDTFTTKAAAAHLSNGLGSAGHHGANPTQLAVYDCLVYGAAIRRSALISDGTDQGGNTKSNDVGLLTAWHQQDADRFSVYFGMSFAEGMHFQGAASQAYLNTVIGVELIGRDIHQLIDGQTIPAVVPTAELPGCFVADFVAHGGCLVIDDFDEIGPNGTGPVVTHEFVKPDNVSTYDPPIAHGVWWDRIENGYRKVTGAFNVDLGFVMGSRVVPDRNPISSRARLLGEIFECWGRPSGIPGVATSPVRRGLVVRNNHPNPFNPTTTIAYTAGGAGEVTLRVFNLRGELVRTMTHRIAAAGEYRFAWHGCDDSGSTVASGVYPYRVSGLGEEFTSKMVLLK